MGPRKGIAVSILLIQLAALAFCAGPLRWEFAHSYAHWIGPIGNALPTLTLEVGLPLLDLGPLTAGSITLRVLVWAIAWLGPVVLLGGVLRASRPEQVDAWLLYGGGLYASVMGLIALVVATSLWLPFALL